MKLKDILLEGRTKPLDLNGARKIFNRNIGSVYKPNQNDDIYRGVNKNYDVGIIRPAQYNRSSAHTDNYYTLIMDNVPEWEEFPDRSKSVICTSSSGEAGDYGDVFKVLPFAGAKIGIASTNDIWKSFQLANFAKLPGNFDLSELNSFINIIVSHFDDSRDKVPTSSFSEFKDYLVQISEKLETEEFIREIRKNEVTRVPGFKKFVTYYYDSNTENLFEFYRSIIHPSNVKLRRFEVKRYDGSFEVDGLSYPGREVWTSSPCLMLRWDGDFLKKFFKDEKYYMKDIDKIPLEN